MDGPWQIGHKTADEYGRLAAETAKAMRLVDPTIELVACGSSTAAMPTFGTWEATVLDTPTTTSTTSRSTPTTTSDGDDRDASSPRRRDGRVIEDGRRDRRRGRGAEAHKKRINLSFDEWNVWYHSASSHGDARPRVGREHPGA